LVVIYELLYVNC